MGGGAALAERLTATGSDGYFVIPRAARLIRSGKPELLQWVEHGYPGLAWQAGFDTLFDHAARRRQAARALGESELESELGDVARRLLDVKLGPHALTLFAIEHLDACPADLPD
jgi:hypothetical protein